MQLDFSTFPLVWMRRDGTADTQADVLFAQFDALLARRQAFVILSEEGFDEDGHEHPQEERKRASLWMKQNKAAIRAYIQGMVLIEPSAAKRLAGKAFAVLFGKFWGYPLHFGTSRDDALDIAQHLLRAWLPPQLPPGDASTAVHQ
ncbi:hypothetical protein O3299_24945 [Janthinobacterium sp. SUN176]|uniref:hypothetical protein n=1 Tax=Janthinobacterium sp. SUN176 TaxID=3014788 RepID=UPI002714493E|nr:hypothetical protein [Janthinobacterium sp. SUN176]MDO8074792.1 hypothetical protein [Janthinobacterium sp. SUN176]